LSLRRLARRLQTILAVEVRAVSLLHSSGINASEIEGRAAELLEPALHAFAREGGRVAVALPLFFGPSAALTEYVPARIAAVQRAQPELRVIQASWLVDASDDSPDVMARLLMDAVVAVQTRQQLPRPGVLLTDHGSPQPGVTAVRDLLGARLREQLGDAAAAVGVASMERRAGDAYAFNEPLLATALRERPFNQGDVIVALQFLQSGRHAGPDGDVAGICRAAEAEQPALRTHLTEPLVEAPGLLDLLVRRYLEAITADASAQSGPLPAHSG
jgi:sirohydrochlorin ferrochelatase